MAEDFSHVIKRMAKEREESIITSLIMAFRAGVLSPEDAMYKIAEISGLRIFLAALIRED